MVRLRHVAPALLVAISAAAVPSTGAAAIPGEFRIATPRGVVAGDLLIAGIAFRGDRLDGPRRPARGWALLGRDRAKGAGLEIRVYLRTATAREPAVHRWRLARSRVATGGIVAFRGVHARRPIRGQLGWSGLARPRLPRGARSSRVRVLTLFAAVRRKSPNSPLGMRRILIAAAGTGAGTVTLLASNGPGRRGVRVVPRIAGGAAVRSSTLRRSVSHVVTLNRRAGAPAPVVVEVSVGRLIGTQPVAPGAPPAASLLPPPPAPAPAPSSPPPSSPARSPTPSPPSTPAPSPPPAPPTSPPPAPPPPPPSPATSLGAQLRPSLPVPDGRELHVSPSGSDSASGSAAAPFKTIQRGADLARPGDTVLVHSGVYRRTLQITRSGTAESPIAIRTAPGETATIRADGDVTDDFAVHFFQTAYVRVQGFVIEGSTGPASANVYVYRSSFVEVSDCEVRGAQRQGIYIDERSSDVQVLRCRIHDNGSTPGQLDHGVYAQGRDHLIASNLITDHQYGFGVQVYPDATGVSVVGNTIVRNLVGVLVGGQGSTAARDTTVANNILAFNGNAIRTYWSGSIGTGNAAFTNLAYGSSEANFDGSAGGLSYSDTITGDPRFRDADNGDFSLAPGSPARGAAVEAFATLRDLNGNVRLAGDPPDLGAIEG